MKNAVKTSRFWVSRIVPLAVLVSFCARSASADEFTKSRCVPGGYVVGFFNGIWASRTKAEQHTRALRAQVKPPSSGESIGYDVFYNASGTAFDDLTELFSQRAQEQDAILSSRWEFFWDALSGNTGEGSFIGYVIQVVQGVGAFASALLSTFRTETISALSALVDLFNNTSNGQPLKDYQIHRAQLDAHMAQQQKIVLVAHSQGNLFMNAAYDYSVGIVGSGAIKAVHVAPASITLRGDYTLADKDFVINGLLLLLGPVPFASNTSIPNPIARLTGNTDLTGHDFEATYINLELKSPTSGLLAPDTKILADIQTALDTAQPSPVAASCVVGSSCIDLVGISVSGDEIASTCEGGSLIQGAACHITEADGVCLAHGQNAVVRDAYFSGDGQTACIAQGGQWCLGPNPGSADGGAEGGIEDAGDAGEGGDTSISGPQPPPIDSGPEGPPAPPNTTGTARGDPHLRTFDGELYDCQPWGEETLCISSKGDLEVQVRTHQLNASNVAVITAVAARVGSDLVAFYHDGTVTLNRVPTTFGPDKTVLPGGGKVWGGPNEYIVVWPKDNNQLWVTINGVYMGVQVFLADGRRSEVSGLLGSANGKPEDDITTRDGLTTLTSPASFDSFYNTYVKSWRITPATSLFDEYPDGGNTESPDITNLNFPRILETAQDLSTAQVQADTTICQNAGVTSANGWMAACLLDVSLSDGDTRAAQALANAPQATSTFDVLSPCASCAADQTCCDGACTSTALDSANCGGCGQACPTRGATCTNGTCGCAPPKSTNCGHDAGVAGACVDLTSDSHNCGKCGTQCSGSTPVCSDGSCVANCDTASGQTQCAGQCVTLGNDSNNCGACGSTCTPSEVCSGGVCTPFSSIGAVGCADGTREAFTNQTTFPAVAACGGGWDGNGNLPNYTGVFPSPLRTTNPNCAQNGNSGPNPNGTGCSAIDLCASGWHICAGGEVLARVQKAINSSSPTDGCKAEATWPLNTFFAVAIGSTGYSQCAEPYGTLTGPGCNNASGAAGCQANAGITNDIFGCGSEWLSVSSCGDVDKSGGNVCGDLDPGWSCGSDSVRESVNAAHNPGAAGASPGGGVLCCATM